ncbi:unnamed protein product [Orchesella dallaii]|uniref:Tyrosinase copper-binding domain-containing protein n=1 Tax=Orchesella dallaii TaxID=48710 RepID=A0ABP1R1G6_9HEXA
MHHQVLSRYNIERVNNGLEEARLLNLTKHGVIREAYYPDVRNINFEPFPYRDNNTELIDAGNTNITYLQTIYTRLKTALMDNYFITPNNSHVEMNTDLLGDTTESSSLKSANHQYYGSFHNYLHRLIAGIGIQEPGKHIPGVQAHPETSMRDPVFYEIHSLVDSLYLQEKENCKPYTKLELDYEGVDIRSVVIESLNSSRYVWWPPLVPNFSTPTITTYFENRRYDVSTGERPCRSTNESPVYVTNSRLNHFHFKYITRLRVKNNLPHEAHAMVRIFLLPIRNFKGSSYTQQQSYSRAIELDRFQTNLFPKTQTVLTRLSLESSVTSVSEMNSLPFRNCGFPNNLLIPKGTQHGVEYKLFVMLTNEPNIEEYPNYAYCGSLNKPFPDTRPMGFPFDRPNTNFKQPYPWFQRYLYKNVKFTTIRVVHKHDAYHV